MININATLGRVNRMFVITAVLDLGLGSVVNRPFQLFDVCLQEVLALSIAFFCWAPPKCMHTRAHTCIRTHTCTHTQAKFPETHGILT